MKAAFASIIVLFIASLQGCAQSPLKGKWYRSDILDKGNGFVQLEISDSQIVFKASSDSGTTTTTPIVQSISSKGITYVVTGEPSDREFRISGFKPFRGVQVLLQTVDPLPNPSWTHSHIKEHPSIKTGLVLYDEPEFKRLQALPPIGSMTTDDYKTFVDDYVEILDKSNYRRDPGAGYYLVSMVADLVGQLGYNPFYTDKEYRDVMYKFSVHPATSGLEKKIYEAIARAERD